MSHSEPFHAPTLSLAHHLLQFFEASTVAPVNKPSLTTLLRDDPVLLANFLDTVSSRPPVIPRADGRWLQTLVENVSDAELQRFAISCVQPWLTATLEDRHWLVLRDLMRQARLVSELARQLARQLDEGDEHEAALTGQLFNLGRLMLFSQSPSRYLDMPGTVPVDPRILDEERRIWGTDHLELAGRRLRRWPLDSYLNDAVCLQYQPLDHYQNSTTLVRVLYVAESLGRMDKLTTKQAAPLAGLLGLSEDALKQCLTNAHALVDQLSWTRLEDEAFCARQREAVRDLRSALGSLALRQVSHLELARGRSLAELAEIAARQLHRYFSGAALFLVSQDRRCLKGFPVGDQPARLAEMAAPLLAGDNLIAHAMLEEEQVNSLDAESFAFSMLDRQLQLLLGGVGFCCLPLVAGGAGIGVMVVRLDSQDQGALTDNHQVRGIIGNLAQLLHGHLGNAAEQTREDPALLVREIYHEVASPISAIRNHIYLLKRQSDEDERETLDLLEKEVGRIADLMAQYRQRSLQQGQASSEVDINRLVRETVSRTVKQAGESCTIEMQLDDPLPRTQVNRLALEQIITNLVNNAIEATGAGDTITVSSHGNWYIAGVRYVEITVADDGPGIPEAIRKQLFSPVISTKGGDHSGLGLNIVRKLADEIQALVQCQSDRAGTRFQVLVPCRPAHNNNKEAQHHAAT